MKQGLILILLILHFTNLYGQACTPNSLVIRDIRAIETDINITSEAQKHQVFINSGCVQNGKLVIHLVGSFDNPANTTYFPSLAANNGFKAINLKYRNNVAASLACRNSNNSNCYLEFREEIIYGIEGSSSVDVDESNSIINRIEKLLIYLDQNHPSESWNNFLTPSGDIDWSKIIISGHSQGGGHAAFIAKDHEVDRVLMFASPNDYSNFFMAPANWISSPSATPTLDYYVFGNLFDDVIDFDNQFEIWSAMNLLVQSDSIHVDNSNCTYNNSSVLYTKIHDPLDDFGTCHNNLIIDNFTPLFNGEPVFRSIWEYMLGIENRVLYGVIDSDIYQVSNDIIVASGSTVAIGSNVTIRAGNTISIEFNTEFNGTTELLIGSCQ